ncbi:carboxylate--amine ligase [Porticoccus sp. GXU_MW_L64]
MAKALVLDANQRASLAITRSLGAQGVEVHTADSASKALSGQSRYSAGYLQYPDFSDSSASSVAIRGYMKKYEIDTLFPVTDLSNQYIIKRRADFDDLKVPLNPNESIFQLADKGALESLARRLDIPFPETWKVGSVFDLRLILNELRYPLVVKPAMSRTIIGERVIAPPISYANSEEELLNLFRIIPEYSEIDVLLQEYIQGEGHGVFLLTQAGKMKAIFAHRRLRERPPSGGVSVLSESISANLTSVEYAKRLLNEVSWNGVAMVEFKLTASGKPYLIEVNTRFWGSLQLAIDSGVDFPFLVYQILQGKKVDPELCAYQTGRKLRWLLGDLDYLYLLLCRKSSCIRNTGRCAAILKFLKFYEPQMRYEVNRLSDMAPFWFELKRYLKRA